MINELISVVVPAYNCAPWLPRCLDSLLSQTYPNLEIIVVNDGSTDNTEDVLDIYASKDSRIQCVHQENRGVTSARLAGVRVAKGQWISFADSDDELAPEMLTHLMENAGKYDADISHCGFQEIHPDGRVNQLHGTGLLKVQGRKIALQDLLEEKIVEPSLCTKLFKAELFTGLEEKMDTGLKNNEDMLMNYFLFDRASRVIFEDICLYNYLIRQGSASRRKLSPYLIYDPIRVRQIILDNCEPELKEDARRALVRMCLVSYRLLAMETEQEYEEDRKNIRQILVQQLPYCSVLSRRNAILVRMIAWAPCFFDRLYPSFERIFRK